MQKQMSRETSQWTILDVLKWTTGYFAANDIDSPRLTAEILLAGTLGLERIELYVRFEQPLGETERERFKSMVKRRIRREPVAYILGRKEFWTVTLGLTPEVLIPRPETEILVETALELMPGLPEGSPRIMDAGTGSGAIAISLARSAPGFSYFASDISGDALRVAARNAAFNNVSERISFFAANWFEPVSKSSSFGMIVSNPPYIPAGEIAGLAPEVALFEPAGALDGDVDGLRDISRLIAEAHFFLSPGGFLLLEIGHDQKGAVEGMAGNRPEWDGLFFRKDYGGHPRVAVLQKRRRLKNTD